MALMVQDPTNPMLAQIPHVLLAAHAGTIMGVETNAMQFYPEASAPRPRSIPASTRGETGRLTSRRSEAPVSATGSAKSSVTCPSRRRLSIESADDYATSRAFGVLLDPDRPVEEGGDGRGVGPEVLGHRGDGVLAPAVGEGQGDQELVGRVGVDRAVRERRGGRAVSSTASSATASAGLPRSPRPTNVAGATPVELGRQARSPPPAPGPRRLGELDRQPRSPDRPSRATARSTHPLGDRGRELGRPRPSPPIRTSGPRSIRSSGRGSAGSIQASSRPPPRG